MYLAVPNPELQLLFHPQQTLQHPQVSLFQLHTDHGQQTK